MQPTLDQLYDVVDDNDNVILQVPKYQILKEGLLHRGINVLFYSKSGNIILQKRAPTKNTFPNKIDVTVGGHVDASESYEHAAIREVFEETGLEVRSKELHFLTKIRRVNVDKQTATISNYFCVIYSFNFEDSLNRLHVESGKAAGFVSKSIKELINVSDEVDTVYSPSIVKEDYKIVWKKLMMLMEL